jgi:hypothetical protein
LYRLAKDLGKSVKEILELPTLELRGWVEFYDILHAEQKKAERRKGKIR